MLKIYCDMDGVLTNFDLAYSNLGCGSHLKGDYTPDFYENLSKAGEDFWTNMEWIPDGKKLWESIREYNPIILSAPTDDPTSIYGKINWIRRELGWHVKYILEKDKYKYADKNSILIDDNTSKLDPWKEKGGIAILHTSASNTINLLRDRYSHDTI